MKKIWYILMIIIIIMAMLGGCGGPSKQAGLKAADEEVKKVEEEINEAAKEAGSDVKVSLGEMGSNLKAPDSFPKDVVPILEDANIVNVNDNKDSKAIGIIYLTGKKYEEAVAFYTEALGDAKNLSQQSDQNSFFMSGKKEDYGFIVSIAKTNDGNFSIYLDVSYYDKAMKEQEALEKKSYYDAAETVVLSDGYPAEQFPILQEDKITDSQYSESDSDISYYVYLISNKTMKDILDSYDKNWQGIENKSKDLSSSEFTLQGESGKYQIYINGSAQDDEAKSVEYNIQLVYTK